MGASSADQSSLHKITDHVFLEGPVRLKSVERANAKQKRLEDFLAPLGLELGRRLLVLVGKVGERKVDPKSLGVDLDQLLDDFLQASQSILSEKTRLNPS